MSLTLSTCSHHSGHVVQVSNMVSRELEKECIVVFDEAHNIDNVCIEVSMQHGKTRSSEKRVMKSNSTRAWQSLTLYSADSLTGYSKCVLKLFILYQL